MEIEPMRAIGVALDKATLQQTMYSLGIDRTYDSLTRAQKTELLYYQIMTQTTKMQGELGRTLATPSQALRIMKQEFTQLGRAIGSIFIPIMMKIIPVVRAVVQVLTSAAKAIANFFGFDISDYTSEVQNLDTSIGGISDGLDDVASSASGAAKEMNKMLMPFDELNNINFSNGSGSGGGIGGVGAGGSLLSELPEYNIFDSITGNVNKEVEKWKKKIEELLPVIKTVGIALAGIWSFAKVMEFLGWVTKVKNTLDALGTAGNLIKTGLGLLFTIGGIYAQYQGTKKLLKGDFSLWAILETLGGTALGTYGIVTILKQLTAGKDVALSKTMNQVKFGLGVMLALQALQVIKDGIEKQDIGKMLWGALEMGLSAASITSSFGKDGKTSLRIGASVILATTGIEAIIDSKKAETVGQQIGESILGSFETGLSTFIATKNVFAGLLAGFGSFAATGFDSLKDIVEPFKYMFGEGFYTDLSIATGHMERLQTTTQAYMLTLDESSPYLVDFKEKLNEISKSYDELKQGILENRDAKLLEISENEGYLESLDRIVDENGKVKQGYEELGQFILNEFSEEFGEQYELIDGVIYKNGEAISSYAEFRKAIDENIKKMKEEAEQAANIEIYKNSYNERKKLEEELRKAKLEHEKAEIELQKAQEKGIDTTSEEFKKINQHFLETGVASEELKSKLNKNWGEITSYSITAFGTLYDSLEEGNDVQAERMRELFTTESDTWEKIFNTLDNDQKLLMLQMTSTANTWNPKLAQIWQDMANKMPEKFQNAFNETQNKVNTELQKMSTTTQKSSLPKDYKALAELAKNRFNENFDINSIVTSKIQGVSNTMYSNSYVVENAASTLRNNIMNILDMDTTWSGKNVTYGVADGISVTTFGTKLQNAVQGLVNRVFSLLKGKSGFDTHSPSKRMRDEIGYFLPLGIAEGIDDGAWAVENSVQNLVNKTRIDMQDFEFLAGGDFASTVNGKISAQTAVALNDNTLQNMTNATYEAMSRALIDNNDDYNPQFNVYVGNDKIYSGYANYQNNESNRYGVRV